MSESLFDQVLSRVLEQTLRLMAGMKPEPSAPQPMHPIRSAWSWVKIVDPRPAMVVIGMDIDLAGELARMCLGDTGGIHASGEIRDAQAELTNVVAGRLAQELLGRFGLVTLGIPRTGRGMPNLQDGTWTPRHFQVGGRWLSIFTQGRDLLDAQPARPSGRLSTPINDLSTVVVPRDPNDIVPVHATPDQHFTPIQIARSPTPDGMPVRIGHYRIIDHLGAGGMGVVYKAHHDTLDRLVALKVMRPDLANDQSFMDRFLREGRASATIDHPNVVPVYDAGFEEGQLYMAMRFVPGGDLATLLHRGGPLPEERSLLLLLRCLEGLQAIADAHMIHRDIKPANILLEANGMPRLADLGLARSLVQAQLSQPGAPQGTPAFMSPEQARALRNIDIRCDIYSLGVTLYCMVTGQPPFHGESPYDVVAKVLYHPVPDPRWIRKDLHDDTAEMCMKAMAKEPDDRFQTPQDFQRAVETVMQAHRGLGEPKSPAPNNYWLRKLFQTPRPG
jgi:hypothetical protein